MYKLICMSFDGEYQQERPTFETVAEASEYSSDLGSKWFFYPFHFVVTESGKTIVGACDEWLVGKRVKSVAKMFETTAKMPDAQNMDADQFADFLFAVNN